MWSSFVFFISILRFSQHLNDDFDAHSTHICFKRAKFNSIRDRVSSFFFMKFKFIAFLALEIRRLLNSIWINNKNKSEKWRIRYELNELW